MRRQEKGVESEEEIWKGRKEGGREGRKREAERTYLAHRVWSGSERTKVTLLCFTVIPVRDEDMSAQIVRLDISLVGIVRCIEQEQSCGGWDVRGEPPESFLCSVLSRSGWGRLWGWAQKRERGSEVAAAPRICWA